MNMQKWNAWGGCGRTLSCLPFSLCMFPLVTCHKCHSCGAFYQSVAWNKPLMPWRWQKLYSLLQVFRRIEGTFDIIWMPCPTVQCCGSWFRCEKMRFFLFRYFWTNPSTGLHNRTTIQWTTLKNSIPAALAWKQQTWSLKSHEVGRWMDGETSSESVEYFRFVYETFLHSDVGNYVVFLC